MLKPGTSTGFLIPYRGDIWANYQLVDPDSDENFTHMVPVAPSNVFWMDPGDKVRQLALGIHPVSPPHLTYKKDLMEYGQDIMTKFISTFYQAKNPEVTATAEVTVAAGPVGMATHAEEVTMEVDSPSKTKATDKCQVKSSSSMMTSAIGVSSSASRLSSAAPLSLTDLSASSSSPVWGDSSSVFRSIGSGR